MKHGKLCFMQMDITVKVVTCKLELLYNISNRVYDKAQPRVRPIIKEKYYFATSYQILCPLC